MALLTAIQSDDRPIAGALIDVSAGGFRVRHSCGSLRPNQIVAFIHRYGEGVARVIWHQATDTDFETGFQYLEDSGA